MSELELEIAAQMESICHDGAMLMAFPRGRHAQFQSQPAKVSVCIPVYNGVTSLARCLDSLSQQSYDDFQVLIVDNASTDHTFANACRFAAGHANAIVYRNPANIGRSPNWNRCLDLAPGKYLKFVMVHDLLMPSYLAEVTTAMEVRPDVVLARSAMAALKPEGEISCGKQFPETTILSGADVRWLGMTQGNMAAGPTAQMFRRRAIAECRLRFDCSYSWAADWDFAMRLLESGAFLYLDRFLYQFDTTAQRFYNDAHLTSHMEEETRLIVRLAHEFQKTLPPAEITDQVSQRLRQVFEEYRAKTQSFALLAEMEHLYRDTLKAVTQTFAQ